MDYGQLDSYDISSCCVFALKLSNEHSVAVGEMDKVQISAELARL